jgi:hypothetical protein
MLAAEIRRAIDAAPFRPFELVTGDGGRYAVPTADHFALSPTGRVAAVFHDDGSASHLDVFLVTALHYPRPNGRSGSRRKRGA